MSPRGPSYSSCPRTPPRRARDGEGRRRGIRQFRLPSLGREGERERERERETVSAVLIRMRTGGKMRKKGVRARACVCVPASRQRKESARARMFQDSKRDQECLREKRSSEHAVSLRAPPDCERIRIKRHRAGAQLSAISYLGRISDFRA